MGGTCVRVLYSFVGGSLPALASTVAATTTVLVSEAGFEVQEAGPDGVIVGDDGSVKEDGASGSRRVRRRANSGSGLETVLAPVEGTISVSLGGGGGRAVLIKSMV